MIQCISEADPISLRPRWLYAESRTKVSKFSLSKVSLKFIFYLPLLFINRLHLPELEVQLTSKLSTYGTADIKLIGNNIVLIAVNTNGV